MEELVRRAVDGDARAFEALVRETSSSIHTVVRSYVRNPEDVSDLVQEVFLRALQRLGDLDDPTRFRPWLYAIARNAGLDHVRKTRRRPSVSHDDEAQGFEPVDVEAGPEELAEVRELAEHVRVGIGRLAPRDATLLAMVTTLGFTPTDVAGALGMTPTAAKVAIHRARQRLRNAMLLESTLRDGGHQAVVAGCSEFRQLVADRDLVEAALHARSCTSCGSRAPAR